MLSKEIYYKGINWIATQIFYPINLNSKPQAHFFLAMYETMCEDMRDEEWPETCKEVVKKFKPFPNSPFPVPSYFFDANEKVKNKPKKQKFYQAPEIEEDIITPEQFQEIVDNTLGPKS